MVKFVCPHCDSDISNGGDSVVSQAINHMEDSHGQDVSRDWVQGNIDAQAD